MFQCWLDNFFLQPYNLSTWVFLACDILVQTNLYLQISIAKSGTLFSFSPKMCLGITVNNPFFLSFCNFRKKAFNKNYKLRQYMIQSLLMPLQWQLARCCIDITVLQLITESLCPSLKPFRNTSVFPACGNLFRWIHLYPRISIAKQGGGTFL